MMITMHYISASYVMMEEVT